MNVSVKINSAHEDTKDLTSFYKAHQSNITSVLQKSGKKKKTFTKWQGRSVRRILSSNTGQCVYHSKQLLT